MGQFLAEYLGEALVNRCSWLPEDLRAYHRGLLLRLLGEEGPMTRRDLAQRSALSLPTVASIVSELLIAGQITESIPRSDRVAPRGPRAGRLRLLSLPLGWRDVPVAERFEEAFGVPAVVEYNVRAMALAEARHGLGQRAENLLYVHLGEGFGLAFVVNGVAFRQGAHGVPELGHHQVAERGPRCSCGGVGCLESVLGTTSLRQRIREAARQSPALRPLLRRRLPVLEVLDMA